MDRPIPTLLRAVSHAAGLVLALGLAMALPAAAQQSAPPAQKKSEPRQGAPDAKPSEPAPDTTTKAAPRSHPWSLPGGKMPESPLERARLLDNLYAHLATADEAATATKIAETIERLWLSPGSDTINVLMERSLKAVSDKKLDVALKFLDAVVDLAPDYAEGWNRRAYVHYTNNDVARALGDLRRVLALDPNHFKALDGLGQILREIGQKKAALEAYRKLVAVHPHWKDGEQVLKDLEREVGGQGI